jgi:hypothetical protein
MWGEADPMCRIVHHHCPHFWCLILNGRVSVVDDHWLKLSLVLPNPFVALTTGRVGIAASPKLFGTTLHIRNLSVCWKYDFRVYGVFLEEFVKVDEEKEMFGSEIGKL